MRAYADDAVAVLDELLLERVHVYGHSFGGQVALELAFEHPERVRTLVLGATRLGGEPANAPRAHAPLGRPWELLYSRGFLEAHPEEIRADRDALTRRHDVERRQAAASREWDARDRAAALSMPVLVLHGTDDRLVDPANGRRLAEAIPGAELALLDGAGHAYGSEVPEAAAAIVLDFVRRHRGGQA
jgi:pimeloyl-ACP methyl ester carboxylesterase